MATVRAPDQPQGTDDLGLGILIPVLVYDTEPRFFPQRHRKLDDGFIVSAGLHLAVQYLRGGLPQRMLIDVLHRTLELLGIEERALDGVRAAFEPLIRPKAGTRGSPQTAANGLFLLCQTLDRLFNQIMVVLESRNHHDLVEQAIK